MTAGQVDLLNTAVTADSGATLSDCQILKASVRQYNTMPWDCDSRVCTTADCSAAIKQTQTIQ